ncbi:hypothetical protein [Microbulbifer hainanensis]|uniref:hypothetical protein n=1 Tax=Microbulbifer hainanensis TaxID=2735675 RepID=UPI00186918A0|nr:hypothetical protein [Microbulbifer hainanensis]
MVPFSKLVKFSREKHGPESLGYASAAVANEGATGDTQIIHTLHRLSACVIGAFVIVHVFNHLLAVQGIDAHIDFMESFRHLYRQPAIEALLLGCVLFQICSGVLFIKNRWGQRRGFYDRLQAISGGYLAFFLLNHVGAVLYGRSLLHLDTNFYFAAAGIHVPPFQFYFVPYYFLAVVAVFSHLACAAHWLTRARLTQKGRNWIGCAIISCGAAVSLIIILALSGSLYPVDIPGEYKATYGAE